MAEEWTGFIPIAETDIERLDQVLDYLAESEGLDVCTSITRIIPDDDMTFRKERLVDVNSMVGVRFSAEAEEQIPRIIELMQNLGRNSFN